ncbi:signal transduction histidine kinase [Stackebrandtia endophytica]|uniref:Signal transduction histidine kinase n=1 Tax=Stackebrandtia endophytica TaxID=1496996 RepID=A0A543AVX6_9ACTN|nr:sensor histidine kinase [Stackebrandtia endophytica]TQL76729.1 signal transduction histidine kinase [Stackebrandtia endophytica]
MTRPTEPAARPIVRVVRIGQHVIAVALAVTGAARAITQGTPVGVAAFTGVVLLAWYIAGVRLVGRRPPASVWLLVFGVLWVAAVVVSAEFMWLAFLLWLLAGYLLSSWRAVGFSVAVFAVVVGAPLLHYGTTSYASILGPLIGGVFAFGISRGYLELLRDAEEREQLVSSLTRTQREMAELQDELASAQRHSGAIAERTRLSRDIHDTVAQALSSIRLLAHAAADRTEDPAAQRTLHQVETLAQDGIGDVRRIVTALAPTELDDALATALTRMLDRLREQTGIATEVHVDESLPVLPTGVEVALLRTAQSALANVRLHSGAERVVVSLIDADDAVRLDIIDDGRGFDATAWDAAPASPDSSYGLRFMRARLRELGGGLEVESQPGEGTALSAHLPIHSTSEEH